MESIWEVPDSPDEFFGNGETTYRIHDYDYPMDNIGSMGLFLDVVGFSPDQIVTDDGTQVVVTDGESKYIIDSYGEGDFHLHGYSVEVVEDGI